MTGARTRFRLCLTMLAWFLPIPAIATDDAPEDVGHDVEQEDDRDDGPHYDETNAEPYDDGAYDVREEAAWRPRPAPFLAFEWRPLSRGDLTIVGEQRTSGLLVASTDGFARPQVQLDVGAWLTDSVALQGSVGIARATVTTWTGTIYQQQHWGVVRPGLDLKARPPGMHQGLPVPWALLGAHVDVPSSRDVSNGYTISEQLDADEAAGIDRVRLGALGARIGLGVEQRVIGGLSLGAQYVAQWQRSLFVRRDPVTIESQVFGEAALLLIFDWPQAVPPPESM